MTSENGSLKFQQSEGGLVFRIVAEGAVGVDALGRRHAPLPHQLGDEPVQVNGNTGNGLLVPADTVP